MFSNLAVILSYILATFVFDKWASLDVPTIQYLEALTFTVGWTKGVWILGHFWSLSIEEEFYLLWPFAFTHSSIKKRLLIAFLVIATIPCTRVLLHFTGPWDLEHFSFLGRGDAIMYGCLAAILMHRFSSQMHRLLSTYPTLFRFISICLTKIGKIQGPGFGRYLVPFVPSIRYVCFAYLICSYITIRHSILYYMLNHSVLVGIGVLSYGIYVWQQLVLYPSDFIEPYWWQVYPINLVVVLILALFSYFLVEIPFLRLRDRFIELLRLQQKRKALT